ncbi:tastin isoform X2 [Ornithorhynchus anatinus]|uniref:tastin isoform X2 n=1 Tax=Ornithorhynchus anatinus TaxID=9258 RepID=UPI0010A84335|nr:tastin isoform X2 [Ornithorhynchus anatinus]
MDQSRARSILQTGEGGSRLRGARKWREATLSRSPSGAVTMAMARGGMETPARAAPLSHSKIPILSGSRLRCPDGGRGRADQENWNPQGSIPGKAPGAQLPVGTPPHPRLQQRLQTPGLDGPSSPRTPLEEIKPVSMGQNLGPGPPPKKEVPGALEFVADPAALATILSGVGVSASGLGRQPSLAQRVPVRGSRGDISRGVRGARASAYLAPRTPAQRFNLIRASCFSRLEGPGPRGRPVGSREPEAPPLVPRPHVILGPQKTIEQATVTNRALVGRDFGLPTAVAAASGGEPGPLGGLSGSRVGLATLGLAQRVPVKGTWRAAPAAGRNTTGKGDNPIPCRMPSVAPKMPTTPGRVILPSAQPLPLGLAQRMPVAHPPAQTSYSVRRLLAAFPKTPMATPPAPRAHQGAWPGDLSPPSCVRGSGCDEPALPWEQIAVRLFDQEGQAEQSEGPGDHPTAAPQEGELPSPTPPAGSPGPQELSRLQRIALLQQLLQEEVEGLSRATGARGHNLLDKPEVPPPPAGAPASVPLLPAGAPASVTPPLSLAPASVPPWESSSEPPSASPSHLQGARPLWGKQEPSQQPAASTSLTFSSQRPICASPSIRSTRSPGPSGAAAGLPGQFPLALALRQRLARRRAATQHFQEACLDEECAFYTGRSSLPAPPRLCKDPVATLLEWQEALGFVPICIPAPQGKS